MNNLNQSPFGELKASIEAWSGELGFQAIGITNTQLGEHENHLENWLEKDFHGEMSYMAAHGKKRSRPDELVENTCRIISLRMKHSSYRDPRFKINGLYRPIHHGQGLP